MYFVQETPILRFQGAELYSRHPRRTMLRALCSFLLITTSLAGHQMAESHDDLTKIATVVESNIADTHKEDDLLIIPFTGDEQRIVTQSDKPTANLTDNKPTSRRRRQAPVNVKEYCGTYQKNFHYFCELDNGSSGNEDQKKTLAQFCSQYAEFCVIAAQKLSAELPEISSAEIDSGRKNGGHKGHDEDWENEGAWELSTTEKKLLKEVRRHPCTPECNVNEHPHCTHDCKCEYDKPIMMKFCDGPLDLEDVRRCKHWFRMCPRQSPLHRKQYDALGRPWPQRPTHRRLIVRE